MYNYFMVMGVVEGYFYGKTLTIKLKVKREFGEGSDTFEIVFFEAFADTIKENIRMGDKMTIKGRLVQTTKLEMVGERAWFFKDLK